MTISWQMEIVVGVLVALGAYFIGNINSAVLLSRIKGKDIRKCGSGNPGTMNMIRTYGKLWGALTLVLDVTKGIIPSVLGWLFMGTGEFLWMGADRIGLYVGGLSAALGHIYPVVMKFKGGKGVATTLGICLTAQPLWTIGFFVFGLGFLFVTKIGSLTSFVMMCAPLTVEGVQAATSPVGVAGAILVACIFALTFFAHRKNLVKTFSGNEGRVVLKKSKKQSVSADRSFLYNKQIVVE